MSKEIMSNESEHDALTTRALGHQTCSSNTRSYGAIACSSANRMCTGGRIPHHFRHNLWRPETQEFIKIY